MHLYIYHRQTRLCTICILVLCLSTRPFQGLVGKAAFPPIFFLMCPSRLVIYPVWVCLFLQGEFLTPWPFGKILRTPLRFWGSPFQLSLSGVFCRILRSCWRIFSHCQFMRKLLRFFFRPIFLAVSLLFNGVLIILPLVWRSFYVIFLVPQLSVMTGDTKSLEGLIFSCKKFPGDYST